MKKLKLNKKIISKLNDEEMIAVKGGCSGGFSPWTGICILKTNYCPVVLTSSGCYA